MNGKELMNILGVKTVAALGVLAVITIIFAAFSYFYLLPQTVEKVGALSDARSYVDGKRKEIMTLRQEYADLQSYMTDFKALEKRGFFGEQNRIMARRELDQVVNDSGLIRANYEIRTAKPIADINAAETTTPAPANDSATASPASGNFKVVVSEIEIEFQAFDDVQVYNFVKRMQDTFPGHVGLRSLEILPDEPFNQDTFIKIGNGQAVPLVRGELILLWYNIIPSEKVQSAEGGV